MDWYDRIPSITRDRKLFLLTGVLYLLSALWTLYSPLDWPLLPLCEGSLPLRFIANTLTLLAMELVILLTGLLPSLIPVLAAAWMVCCTALTAFLTWFPTDVYRNLHSASWGVKIAFALKGSLMEAGYFLPLLITCPIAEKMSLQLTNGEKLSRLTYLKHGLQILTPITLIGALLMLT